MQNEYNISILVDLMKNRALDKAVRLFLSDNSEVDVYVDCLTYVTIADDEDVPAIRFIRKDNSQPITVTGTEIKRYEYCIE